MAEEKGGALGGSHDVRIGLMRKQAEIADGLLGSPTEGVRYMWGVVLRGLGVVMVVVVVVEWWSVSSVGGGGGGCR